MKWLRRQSVSLYRVTTAFNGRERERELTGDNSFSSVCVSERRLSDQPSD